MLLRVRVSRGPSNLLVLSPVKIFAVEHILNGSVFAESSQCVKLGWDVQEVRGVLPLDLGELNIDSRPLFRQSAVY